MRLTHVLFGSVAFALVISCDSMLTRPSLYSGVKVDVTRPDGLPVRGASVILYTGARQMGFATTDASGQHTFDRVPQGVYGVRVLPPAGFVKVETVLNAPPADAVDGLDVRDDTIISAHLTLLEQGTGTVIVNVVDPAGTPIVNTKVTLYDPHVVDDSALTDQNGRVVFSSVAFGVHGIIVERPVLYRDFQAFHDSLYSFRDNLLVEKDTRDSVAIAITKCAGTVDVAVVDQNNQPVRGATVAYFTPTDGLGQILTGADGHARREAPCVGQIGVSLATPLGYTMQLTRGSSFADGITVAKGATASVTLRVQKDP